MQPHVVDTTLNYYLSPERGGAKLYRPGAVSDKRRPHDGRTMPVTDVRGREEEFKLDKQGFQIIHLDTPIQDVEKDEDWRGQYFQDIMEQVKNITGASRVQPVSHIARRQAWDEVTKAEKDMDDSRAVTAPTYSRFVHVDQSYDHARNILNARYPDEAESITQKRWAIVNVWRPLVNPVTRDNLAVCDARSVSDDDLVPLNGDVPQPKDTSGQANGYNWTSKSRSIETWAVNANPEAHRWYYCSKLTPQEAILFKQFDSKRTGVARRTPHTAFVCDEDDGPTRQSVEARMLLVWDDQTND